MKATFLDTSFLLAIMNVEDSLHDRAAAWKDRVRGRLLTTEFVLIEFLDAMCHAPLRRRALDAIVLLRSDANVSIVPLSSVLMEEGISWFAVHHDKDWSMTDCVSFHLMTQQSVTEALTADRHFEQAGFRALLRCDPEQD